MRGSVRKRKSLWDSKEETRLPAETIEKTAFHGRESYSSLHGNDKEWSELDVNDVWEPRVGSGWPSREHSQGNHGQKDVSISRGLNEIPRTTRALSRDKSCDIYTGFDGLEQQYISRSAEKSWNQSHRYRSRSRIRSRSRSRGRGRSRSRSRSRSRGRGRGRGRSRSRSGSRCWDRGGSRSRSRSQSLVYRHESYGWSDRLSDRPGSRLSSQICREFTVGKCRRGSQCRFLHQDSLNHRDGGRSESDRSERWRRRQESEEASDYAYDEGPRDYQRNKISDGYGNFDDRERGELRRSSSRSTIPCNDFLKGRCYRGSSCRYPHHGASGANYERSNRSTSFVNHRKHHPSNIPCKFFAMGRCQRDDCRFSHDGAARGNREGRSMDDRFGHNLDDEKSSWNGPKWGDANGISDVAKSTGLGNSDSGNANHTVPTTVGKWTEDRWGHTLDDENKPWNGPKWGEATGGSGVTEPSGWGNSNVGEVNFADPTTTAEKSVDERWGHSSDDQSRMCNSPQWKDKAAVRDEYPAPRFGNGSDDANMSITESAGVAKFFDKEEHPLISQSLHSEILDGISMHVHEQNTAQEALGQQLAATVMRPVVSGNSNIQLHCMNRREGVSITDGSNALNKENASGSTMFSVLVPEQSFNQSGDSLASLARSSCRTDGSQHMISLNSSNGHSIGLNEPVQQLFSPLNLQDQTQIHSEESVKTLQMLDFKIPQVISEIPQASEQFAQRTNLPASLAQMFGKGQPSQIYATLNPPDPTRLVPSLSNSAILVPPVASMDGQPDTARRSLEQCDHISDSVKSTKPGNSNGLDEENKPMTMEQFSGSSNDEPDSSKIQKHDGSVDEYQGNLKLNLNLEQQKSISNSEVEENNKIKTEKCKQEQETNHQDNVVACGRVEEGKPISNSEIEENNKIKTEKCKQEQETNHEDNVAACGRAEEGNSCKDEKEMRLFKVTLVEFVKEILKPVWKEGQMSREVHKTIVKKVVDKVLSTIQGPNIPKTQDKIDEYLSYSKPKLTKLVQAYVERLMKN